MPVPPLTAAGSCRKKLLEYLYSLKQPDGSFLMHVGGEVDVRWVRAAWRGCSGGLWAFWGASAGSRCYGRGLVPFWGFSAGSW